MTRNRILVPVILTILFLTGCKSTNYSVSYKYAGYNDKPYYSLVVIMNEKTQDSAVLRVWDWHSIDWTQYVVVNRHDINLLASKVSCLESDEGIEKNPKSFCGNFTIVWKKDKRTFTYYVSEYDMIAHLHVLKELPFENIGLKEAINRLLERYGVKVD